MRGFRTAELKAIKGYHEESWRIGITWVVRTEYSERTGFSARVMLEHMARKSVHDVKKIHVKNDQKITR